MTEQVYGWGLPIQASTYAASLDRQLDIFHIAMLVIFVGWGAYMTYCLVRYRAKPGVPAVYGHSGILTSMVPDGIILAFEMFMIFAIGLPVWAKVMETFPDEKQANVVHVIAQQFVWNNHYAGPDGLFGRREMKLVDPVGNPIGLDETDPAAQDDIRTINQMYVPINRPTLVYLSSLDVIHGFNIPAFRTKQDVTPGMRVRIWFEPSKLGTFEIACAQLCGLSHYKMLGYVNVMPQADFDGCKTKEDFDAWMAKKRAEKPATEAGQG